VYFYELHESDDELFSEALLAHDSEYDEQEFLELVLEARGAVLDSFEEDSLIEAVANELARSHGFVHIDDRQLRAAVRVSANDGDIYHTVKCLACRQNHLVNPTTGKVPSADDE